MDTRQHHHLVPSGKNGTIVPLQRGDGKENQPVTLQPSWEANNYPEEELNFKNLTMDEASLSLHEPKDKYNLVYFIFLLHGIGVLMPWNMFITANDYFKFKFSENYTGVDVSYGQSYLNYVTFAAQVPNVIFNWLNIFVQLGGDITTRIVWSIGIQVVMFLLTIVLAMADSKLWPDYFFWVTMVSVVIINIATGIYQNTIYGMAAKLPFKYTAAIILGNNVCGTFVTCTFILANAITDNHRVIATYYFIMALFILLVCFDSYFSLPLNRFYRHHELKQKKHANAKKKMTSSLRPPYLEILMRAGPMLLNVFFIFFCTLSVFPGMHSNVRPLNPNHFLKTGGWYTNVTCFLTFNVTAMIGSILPKFFIWPKPKYLWIPVALRVLYIPFFLFCNYQLDDHVRTLPVWFGDEVYWIVAVTMGLTSGYFSSIAMIYVSTTAEPQHAGTAGMFGGACLITGIFAGILSAFLWPLLID